VVGVCFAPPSRAGRPPRPIARGYRLEVLSQSDAPSTTVDVGRRFVVAVFKITN
jgi:hypothetical protein